MEPRIPMCQEEGEVYCVSCGDRACCAQHAQEGCGYTDKFEWPAPAVEIIGVKVTGSNVTLPDGLEGLNSPVPHVKNVLSGSGVQVQRKT